MHDLQATNRREVQLDLISSLLVIAMAVVVGLLLLFMSRSGIQLPSSIPLASYIPRILLGGFIILVVLYLADQRRRLREQVNDALAQTEAARSRLDTTCQWLQFSHESASLLGSEGVDEGMRSVLSGAAALFKADAAAVLSEDEEFTFIAPDAPHVEAERALTHVALVTAGSSQPQHIQALGTESGEAIAVPLRVAGDLRHVLCIWRRKQPFEKEELDALGLMGRMVELAIEREESLKEAHAQLEGTLRVLQYLVADKRPDYSRHAINVADLAAEVGRRMGLRPEARKDLRLAGLIHDVGMMGMPRDVGLSSRALTPEETLLMRQHPRIGSEIAKAANFGVAVQEAVAAHHERVNGTGYPLGLAGSGIPIGGRILAVCEVYDSMSHRAYHGAATAWPDAIRELTKNAGTLYDADAVCALVEVVRGLEDDELEHPVTSVIVEPQAGVQAETA